jgi:hypothetical protein
LFIIILNIINGKSRNKVWIAISFKKL